MKNVDAVQQAAARFSARWGLEFREHGLYQEAALPTGAVRVFPGGIEVKVEGAYFPNLTERSAEWLLGRLLGGELMSTYDVPVWFRVRANDSAEAACAVSKLLFEDAGLSFPTNRAFNQNEAEEFAAPMVGCFSAVERAKELLPEEDDEEDADESEEDS